MRNALARNVKGGTVVDRSANDGQPKRRVDCVSKPRNLGWNVALVMVESHDGIKLALLGAQKYRVWWYWATKHASPALSNSLVDDGLNDTRLFVAKYGFTVRIQSRNGDAGLHPGASQKAKVSGQANGLEDPSLICDANVDITKRDVAGGMRDDKPSACCWGCQA